MKNIAIAIMLTILLGLGFYYFKSGSQTAGDTHSHEGGQPHSH